MYAFKYYYIGIDLYSVPVCVLPRVHPGGNLMANLYESILRLCERDGIRPGRLCNELGISRGLMTDLKMGRKKGVSAETAQKIASFFGVSVGVLLGMEEMDAEPIDLDQVDVAFYGEFKELTEEDKETVRDMVRLMRQRRATRQRE